MITPEALRAARALLKWGTRETADASGVSWMTISEAENGRPLRKSTADKIVSAFAAHGVEIVTTDKKTGALIAYARPEDADNE